jgi:hypothetical protein
LDPQVELQRFAELLSKREPFVFVRFSDGETEILKGNRLELGSSGVIWSKGQSNFVYPKYDHKSFDPLRDSSLHESLLKSAQFRSPNYFKGIPTRHNRDKAATMMMHELNGGSWDNLSFADLWVNSNFRLFLSRIVEPLVQERVTVLANYRAKPKRISPKWELIPVPDGAFQVHDRFKSEVLSQISELPSGSVILSSASSLSNLIGHEVATRELRVSFVDIGTALHPQLGFEDSRRLYLSQLKPWTLGSFREKLAYRLSGGNLKW